MVRAILAGQKTVTRRVVTPQPHGDGRWSHIVASTDAKARGVWSLSVPDPSGVRFTDRGREREVARVRCPYGMPGDTLWVRETFNIVRTLRDAEGIADDEQTWRGPPPKEDPRGALVFDDWHVAYAADDADADEWPWRPSIHMPRWASRITLRVEDVRVERLHAIDEADAVREGVDAVSVADVPRNAVFSRRDDFAQLWQKINGKRAPWSSNPWVWRVAFSVVEVKR